MSTDTHYDSVQAHTYEATLYGPLFYASEEGSVIRTDPTIAATALTHAIGYNYYDLTKRYLLTNQETVEPSYDHLLSLPFVVSEMTPVSDQLEANERTFRTVSYATERTVVSSDTNVGEFLTGAKSPVPRSFEGSNAGWHKVREYVGISPDTDGSEPTFRFTMWTPQDSEPPESLGLRVGIKRTGELRAERTETAAESVSLNQFLLQSVYDLSEEQISDLLRHADSYERGTDVRTCRFRGVDRQWAEETIVPQMLAA
ncbi:hypothetical protein DVK02_14495 [Halobellus sp. Atlit-31R]|nr:hypothetical protein DVK02_14495 [Halobellus sp. Atlit-31R]